MSNQRRFYLRIFFFIISITIIESFVCEKDGFFPDKRDCWIYHICVGTTHAIKACKEDLLFNPIKNQCDWAINVNCTSTTQRDSRPIHAINISINDNNNSSFDDLCQLIDNDYVAHPKDCKQYAYCANGAPQAKICKKPLLWSQTEKMCVWPAQSDCPVKTTPKPTTIRETSPISSSTTHLPSTLPLLNVSKSFLICPPNKSWRIHDPYDCSMYHDCYHGTDLVTYCPGLFQYNREKQKCDHAENVRCKNKCTNKNEGARFVDPSSCCHFYECQSNQVIHQTCSQPNLFDIETRKCVSYKQVKCDGRRQCLTKCHYNTGKSSCDSTALCTGHSDGFYPDRSKPNCQFYIQCLDNRVNNYHRCSYGQRFNTNTGRCISADQVPCLASLSNRVSLILLIFLCMILY